jgi:hypothetical protein
MKLHIYRLAIALLSFASLVETLGAGRKLC